MRGFIFLQVSKQKESERMRATLDRTKRRFLQTPVEWKIKTAFVVEYLRSSATSSNLLGKLPSH